jgi:hypothetical protein
MSVENVATDNIKALLSDFLVKYGERGKAVLEAAVRASRRFEKKRDILPKLPGDFDYKTLVEELGLMGYSYNPSPILRILERDYGLIKTTLHTSRQRWFIFSSPVVKDVIEDYIIRSREYIDETDPEYLIIKTQLIAVNIEKIKDFLNKLAIKERWAETDYEKLKKISTEDLVILSNIYKKVKEKDEEKWQNIAKEIEDVFRILNKVILAVHKIKEKKTEQTFEEKDLYKEIENILGRPEKTLED